MNRKQRMEQLLKQAFRPEYLDIKDDSERHAGHAGASEAGESHFSVTIVSDAFRDVTQVQRHKMMYDALDSELNGANPIHALQMKTVTPAEVEKEGSAKE